MGTTLLVAKNRAYSKLAAAITAGATSLTVTAGEGANFPSTYPFHLTIDDEIVSCTNRATDSLTIVRARQSTTAAAHSNKSHVALNITAKSMTDLNTAVNTIEGYFTDGFTMPTNKKIMFRAAGNYIHSDAASELMVNATTTLNLAIGGTDEVRLTATALSPATSDGSALGTTALKWADLFLASGAVINFNNGNQTITHDNSTTTLTLTGKLAFGGNTDWGAGATGTVIDGSGYDWVTQTIGRVNTNLNNTAAAAHYAAMSITANQTSSNSIFGHWVELYVSNSVDLTGADNFAAIWGQFEAGTGVTLSDTGCFTAGVYANVKAGATLTVPAGHSLNGFRAQIEVSAITNNGTTAAFECLKSGGVDWEFGLYLADVTTDIRFHSGATLVDDGTSLTLAGSNLVGTLGAVTLAGAVTGGDQAFTNVGDMTFAAGSILASGGSNGNTLLLRGNDTTFITFTTGATDVCELDGCTLDSSIAKGTWTASGTWTIPAVTFNGAVDGNGQTMGSLGHIGIIAVSNANIGIIYDETHVLAAADEKYGEFFSIQGSRITSTFTGQLYGSYSSVRIDALNTQNWTNTLGLIAYLGFIRSEADASGTITGAASFVAEASITAITVTNRYGLYVKNASGSGTVTNQYGIYIEDLTKGTALDYGIYIAGADTYALYIAADGAHIAGSTVLDAVAGNVRILTTGALALSLKAALKFTDTDDSAAVANEVSLSGYEISAGHRALAISSEEVVITEAAGAADRSYPIRINGVTYKMLLKAVA